MAELKLGYKASAEQFAPRELVELAVEAEAHGMDSATVARPLARSTRASRIPGNAERADCTPATHPAHSIPSMRSVRSGGETAEGDMLGS